MPAGGPYHITPAWKFYQEYLGPKASYTCYYQRVIIKGLPFETAIIPGSARIKTKTNSLGRECTECGQFKTWKNFAQSKKGYKGRTPNCLECRNQKKQQARLSDSYREYERQYKKERRKTEIVSIRTKLDNTYYTDKTVRKNREIIKDIRPISRKEARIAKIQYFLFRGYDEKFLKKIYGSFDPTIRYF